MNCSCVGHGGHAARDDAAHAFGELRELAIGDGVDQRMIARGTMRWPTITCTQLVSANISSLLR